MNNESYLLIEPIIKRNWLGRLFHRKWLYRFFHQEQYAISLKKTSIVFKVTAHNINISERFELKDLSINEKCFVYNRTYDEEFEFCELAENQTQETKPFQIVFPYDGIFWIDIHISLKSGRTIPTKQRLLEGGIGRGEFENKDNSCRNCIIVREIYSVRLFWLTFWLVVLSALMAFDILKRIFCN